MLGLCLNEVKKGKTIIEPLYSNIAYDDAFRTLESKCDDALIPFVNYFFDEKYDDSNAIKTNK